MQLDFLINLMYLTHFGQNCTYVVYRKPSSAVTLCSQKKYAGKLSKTCCSIPHFESIRHVQYHNISHLCVKHTVLCLKQWPKHVMSCVYIHCLYSLSKLISVGIFYCFYFSQLLSILGKATTLRRRSEQSKMNSGYSTAVIFTDQSEAKMIDF